MSETINVTNLEANLSKACFYYFGYRFYFKAENKATEDSIKEYSSKEKAKYLKLYRETVNLLPEATEKRSAYLAAMESSIILYHERFIPLFNTGAYNNLRPNNTPAELRPVLQYFLGIKELDSKEPDYFKNSAKTRKVWYEALGIKPVDTTPAKQASQKVTENSQAREARIYKELQALKEKKARIEANLNVNPSNTSLHKEFVDTSNQIELKEKELSQATKKRELEKKESIINQPEAASTQTGNPTKVNKEVKNALQNTKTGSTTKTVKAGTTTKSPTTSTPVAAKKTESIKTFTDAQVLAKQGVTETTLNFFNSKNPLAVNGYTQLMAGDFSDPRRYEAFQPFFTQSEKPAYIKLIDDIAAPVSFDETLLEDNKPSGTSSKTPPKLSDPFVEGYSYNQFSLQSFMETHNEKYQLIDSMDHGQVLFSFGEKPEFWSISGIVLNDIYNNWLAKLREVWRDHLRLSKLVEKGKYARISIPSQRIAFNGYPVGLTLSHSENTEQIVGFTMLIFVREYKNFTVFPFNTNSANAQLISNLLYLDGVNSGTTFKGAK